MNKNNLCMGCMKEKPEGVNKCLHCGYVEGSPYLPSYLAPRTVLQDRYLLGRVVDYNGEGANYVAFDMVMGVKVRIREYMPDTLATREKGEQKLKVIPGCETQFKALRIDYIDLSKTLMRLKTISAVVHVIDMFEQNNTVYSVYENIEGLTLSEFLKRNGGYLTWEDTKLLFLPLLSALNAMHASEILHRGISPETIMIDRSGNLKLTGFCISSARTARSELVAQLFSGYAAPEQYTSSTWQGTYTDVYAVAATIYRTLTGTMPTEAMSRAANDNLIPAISLNSEIPKNVSNALSAAMLLSPDKRSKSMDVLISQLSEVMDFGEKEADLDSEETEEEKDKSKKKMSDSMRYTLIAGGITVGALLLVFTAIWFALFSEKEPTVNPVTSSDLTSGIASSESTSSASGQTSSGPRPTIAVPQFIGLMIESIEADKDYTDRFKIEKKYEYNEKYGEGIVYEQSPEKGTPIATNQKITLTVSRGSKYRKLPSLVGQNVNYAKDTLNGMNIKYKVETKIGEYGDINTVIGMSLEPDTTIDISQPSEVILYIPEPQPVVSVPDTSSEDSWNWWD